VHQLDALAQAGEAKAGSGAGQLAVRASRGRLVSDDDPDLRLAVADLGEHVGARSVLAGVGECLAHNPVRRAADDRRCERGVAVLG
jgi:hypothetical protein